MRRARPLIAAPIIAVVFTVPAHARPLQEPEPEPRPARLSVKVVPPESPQTGHEETWRLVVRNRGGVDAVRVVVTARMSRTLRWVRGGRYDRRKRTITFRWRRIDSRRRKTFKTVLVATTDGFASLRATVTGQTAESR